MTIIYSRLRGVINSVLSSTLESPQAKIGQEIGYKGDFMVQKGEQPRVREVSRLPIQE